MELNDFESLCAALRYGTNCEERGFSTALNVENWNSEPGT